MADLGSTKVFGDLTVAGDLTAPAVLVSSAQNTSANALTRKDYVDSAIAAGDALQVSKTGDTMTGGLTFANTASELGWVFNTDYAKIGFKNDADSDTDSYMWFKTGDNGNEYFKWQGVSGANTTDWMSLKSTGLVVAAGVTAPKVLVSGAQGAESNALTRKDYVDSTIAAGDALQVSKTGDTMTGNLRFSQEKTGISLHSTADVTGIYNGTGDGASRDVTNLQIKSWYGIGISPTAGLPAGMTMGQNSIWINARNGDISAIGNIIANKSLVSAAQGTEANALTRKDYVDGQVATRAPTAHTHTVAAITDLRPQDANATANTLVLRDGSADVNARLLRTTFGDESAMSGAIAFRVNNSTNNYTRYCNNPESVRNWMKGAKTNWDMGWRAYIEHADNPMTEYHIPGMTAVITYLTSDGNYRITSSNGAGGAVADRLRVDASGNLFTQGAIHEAGQRVYSPNNRPPASAYQFQGERRVGDSIPLTNGAEIVLTEDVRGRMGRSQILDNGLNVQVMIQFPVIDSIFSVAQGNDHTVFELYGYGRRLKRLRGWGEGGPWQGFWVFT